MVLNKIGFKKVQKEEKIREENKVKDEKNIEEVDKLRMMV